MRSENNAKTREHNAEQRNTLLVLSLNTESSYTHLTSCLRKLFFSSRQFGFGLLSHIIIMMTKFNYALKELQMLILILFQFFPLNFSYFFPWGTTF